MKSRFQPRDGTLTVTGRTEADRCISSKEPDRFSDDDL